MLMHWISYHSLQSQSSVYHQHCVFTSLSFAFQTRPQASFCWRQTGSPSCRSVTSSAKETLSTYSFSTPVSIILLCCYHRDDIHATNLLRSVFAFLTRAKYAIGAIKKKLNDKNPHVALYALEVSGGDQILLLEV